MKPPLKSSRTQSLVLATLAVMAALGLPAPTNGQTIEVMPLAGYRFNNDLFEAALRQPVDLDGAPIVGGAVNVGMGNGLWFEGLFTRQEADVNVAPVTSGPQMHSRIVVDQWLAGGRQEFGGRRALPFLTGLLGLTRYGADGDGEVRFTVGAGGGLKVPVQRWIGVRLDSRLLTTFVDLDARAGACGPRGCLIGVDANVVWQFELTADVVLIF
jgi:hypothetical protein